MCACVVDTAGGGFRTADVPDPVPGTGQILVRIEASGLNPLDAKIRVGKADHEKQPLLAVLGMDMAGFVETVGPEVIAFHPGDEVYGMVGGVGHIAVQLAHAFGAEVFATASTDKAEIVKDWARLRSIIGNFLSRNM